MKERTGTFVRLWEYFIDYYYFAGFFLFPSSSVGSRSEHKFNEEGEDMDLSELIFVHHAKKSAAEIADLYCGNCKAPAASNKKGEL